MRLDRSADQPSNGCATDALMQQARAGERRMVGAEGRERAHGALRRYSTTFGTTK